MDLEDLVSGELDVIGAALSRNPMLAAAGSRRGLAAAQEQPGRRWMKTASPQGVSLPNEEMDFLPFTTAPITAGLTTTTAIAFPQRPFRGERMIASAIYLTAAGVATDASNAVYIDPAVYVGATQVGASQGRVPLSVFAANAFGVRLSWPSAGQGTRVFIPITSVLTVAAGDSIVVNITAIGKAVRLVAFSRQE